MRNNVFMAGFGGQGILLAGNLLACAAIHSGLNASFFPAYGVEKRGGSATCTVVLSDSATGSPVVGRPESALLLNQEAVDRDLDKVLSGGFCLVNSSLVVVEQVKRDDLDLLCLPLNEEALAVGDTRLVNMITLGAYVARTRVVSVESLKESLTEVLPERNHRFIPLNHKAIDRGVELASCR
jgi:2-oxoglutarate ferredoxin oxidoreductase subunit gamma